MQTTVIVFSALFLGCAAASAPKPLNTPAEPSAPRLLVSVDRSSCFGSCPAYRLEVDTDGAVRFEPRMHICVEGFEVHRLRSETVAALRAAIAQSGFDTLPEGCCDLPCSDTSVLTLTVGHPRPMKTIVDSDCLGTTQTVRDLARAVERIVGIERWIGTAEQRERCQ